MQKRRCVIIGAAPIQDMERIRALIRKEDYLVVCDGGLYHLEGLGIKSDLIIGDFDSHPRPETSVEMITLPHEKDDTDTAFAAKECMRRGFDHFLLLGVIGLRMDHSLGNLGVLQMLFHAGKEAVIADDYGEMQMVGSRPALVDSCFPYFSLLAISGKASGVNVRNALYPLRNAEIFPDVPLGVSNEPLPGKTAEISVAEGELLLLRILNA